MQVDLSTSREGLLWADKVPGTISMHLGGLMSDENQLIRR